MKKSDTIGALAKALAAAQGALKPAPKGAENPFFKSSYADLPAIVKACRDALAKNDISYVQAPSYEGEIIVLETILMHSSGEWISSIYPVKPVKPDPQSLGSAFTYAKRYALAAMVGVVSEDEDDDANAASDRAKAPSREEKGDALTKARDWAKEAIREINGMAADEVDTWATKNAPAMVKLRAIDQDTHAQLMAAIQKSSE